MKMRLGVIEEGRYKSEQPLNTRIVHPPISLSFQRFKLSGRKRALKAHVYRSVPARVRLIPLQYDHAFLEMDYRGQFERSCAKYHSRLDATAN